MPTRLAELGSAVEPLPTSAGGGTARSAAQAAVRDRLADLRAWLAAAQAGTDVHEPRRARLVHVGTGTDQRCPDAAADLAQLSVREVPVTGGDADPLAAGASLADSEVDAGTDLVVLSLGGAEVVGPALISVVTGVEPVKLLPRGARLSVAEWTRRAVAVRDGRRALAGTAGDPDALLAAVCALATEQAASAATEACRLAVACGLLLQATARRTPIVLDGVGAAAAAALCAQAVPAAAAWWRAAEQGADPGYDVAAEHTGLDTVLPMTAGGPDGVAGALAVLTLRLAVRAVA